jgi:phosphatidylglycerophosphate synthase
VSALTTAGVRGRHGYRSDLEALGAAQKPPFGTGAYSRHVNRPLARRVAAAGHQVGLTPNAATGVSAALSTAGLALVALVPPSWPLGAAVAALLALGYVLDSVDGQLARLRGRGTVSGEWLDHTVDCVKTCGLHLVVLVCLYRFGSFSSDAVLLLPLAFLVVDVTSFFWFQQVPLLRAKAGGAPPTDGSGRTEGRWRRWLLLPTDYGTFCWMFVLLGDPTAFLAGYALMLAANATFVAAAGVKWWRELRALDERTAS